MSRLRLQLLAAAVLVLAWTQSSALEPKRESGILPIDPPTPYIHYFGGEPPRGRVLVIHGFDVSKEVMQLISAALADGGFEVYAVDLPGHGASGSKFQTELAQQAIHNAKAFLGEKTIVLGHSLGAGLLLDLAATEPFSTIVLLSPPPLSISEIHAEHVLIATGELDIPRIRAFVPIAADIGTPNVESWIVPWGGHSAPIFNPAYVKRIVEWLGGDGAKTSTAARMFWIATMLAAAVGLGVALLPGKGTRGQTPRPVAVSTVLVHYVVACGAALFILKLVRPLGWLRLFATDYLIGFLLVTGFVLTALSLGERTERPRSASPIGRSLKEGRSGEGRHAAFIHATLAAAFVIALPGFIVASHVLHVALSDGRWWRFPCIVLAGLPLFISDELMIRRIHPRWKSEAIALLTRGLFLAFLLTGVLVFNRENAFLVLIVPLIVIFWIALCFAAGVVHRHTQNALASALFAALVQGWAFAAWFVTI